MYRFCYKAGLKEETNLVYGMDFRKPEYRRETFLRFYEFHLKHRAHPGCVYSILPFFFKQLQLNVEERLWFCFINGNTQNPFTSYVIFKRFPDLKKLDLAELESWFVWWSPNLQFDTDRRHHKSLFVESVKRYRELLKSRSQLDYFAELLGPDLGRPFGEVFKTVQKDFFSFGRLSSFSYLEYLFLNGLGPSCNQLFLEDREGSRSHRNGLCKVLGRDDLDWHKSNPTFDGSYKPELIQWLDDEARMLLVESTLRFGHLDFGADVGYFTLESALCTYKSWFRPGRRYPGVYLDMARMRMDFYAERFAKILKGPLLDTGDCMKLFNDWRDTVPKHLRTESNPGDLGLKKEKQNHFLKTGQPVMMDREWPCFKNDYNDKVNKTTELFS